MKHWGWKVRLFVGLLMLLLGFIGLIITNAHKQGGWNYWRWTAVVYAALSIGMNWHLKKIGWKKELVTIWQEILHWTGLLLSIWLVSFVVHIGLQDRFEASLEVLILLALATYLAGIYIDVCFIPIGLILGLFAAGLAFFDEYLYALLVPLTILGILYLVWESRRSKNLSE
ncbi:MAG: hypothetical protein JSR93_00545 [Verrucomicrobia bacterium]|nr:hypothetical protein [Verrucomicrobiota bacterium]